MYQYRVKTTSRLRQTILRAYRDLWQKSPAENQYAITQDLWTPIWEEWKGQISLEFGSSVLNGLNQEGLVENLMVANPQGVQTAISRITPKGLLALAETEASTHTRRLAMFGAITGCLALLLAIAALALTLKHYDFG